MRALVEDMTGDHPARPCVVVSNVADAGGIAWAKERGIPTEVVDHKPFAGDRAAFENELTARLMPHAPDIICLAGFMRKLTGGFTDAWAGRMINIHPSLLPRYKGLHTHARALEAGDTQQATIPVMAGDTPEDLAARVLVQEHRLYPAVLRRFASGNRDLLMLES